MSVGGPCRGAQPPRKTNRQKVPSDVFSLPPFPPLLLTLNSDLSTQHKRTKFMHGSGVAASFSLLSLRCEQAFEYIGRYTKKDAKEGVLLATTTTDNDTTNYHLAPSCFEFTSTVRRETIPLSGEEHPDVEDDVATPIGAVWRRSNLTTCLKSHTIDA